MAQAANLQEIAQGYSYLADQADDARLPRNAIFCREKAAKYNAQANAILWEIAAEETLAGIAANQAPPQKPRRSWLAAAVDLVRQCLGFRLR